MTVAAWDLGNTIRSSRIKKGYTQEALSELLDITPSHLKQMEGGRRNPSVPLLFQMMELLDFSVDALVFPERESAPAIHTDGLTEREAEALARLVDAMKARELRRLAWMRGPPLCILEKLGVYGKACPQKETYGAGRGNDP